MERGELYMCRINFNYGTDIQVKRKKINTSKTFERIIVFDKKENPVNMDYVKRELTRKHGFIGKRNGATKILKINIIEKIRFITLTEYDVTR